MPSSDMDVDRPKSREAVILTENTDDFIIGDRVWVHGTKPGYIQYLGEVQFSPGDWAGVVLDDNSGKNDGSVAGVRYFQCEPKRGVFARLHKLTRYPLVHATPSPSAKLGSSPTPPPIQRCLTPTRTPSPGGRILRDGDRVTVTSSTGPPKTGVLRYLGHTDFATGEWAGVELDEPVGKNDGTVAGKRYFKCSPNYGLFAPSHKVARVTGSLDRHRRTHHNSGSQGSEKESSSKNSSTQNLNEENRRYTEESEKRAQKFRKLLEAAENERRELATKLEEERRKVEELEFRIEEECIGKDDIEAEREKERRKVEDLEMRLQQETRKNEMISGGASPDSIMKDEVKRLNDEIVSLRNKLRQTEFNLKEAQMKKQAIPPPSNFASNFRSDELMRKEEALLQAQLSLDNKKREVQNLLDRMTELERELEKSKARQSRQLDSIDDLNVKLQKMESKCTNFEEELHCAKEKSEEFERRLRASQEHVTQLETEKHRLEEKLLTPESTPKEQELHSRLQEREREIAKWHREAENLRKESDRLREDREKMRKEFEEKIRSLKDEHAEEFRKNKKKISESEESNKMKVRDLEKSLSQVRVELESARAEADVRLSRQQARLQEAELKTENVDRLRDQISRLQAEKDLISVEKEEMWKRLQTSEKSRQRWELEANKASEEVNLLKSQVHHLRSEFTSHREDLVKKLAETEFDSKLVQELHIQIEEQRRVVEQMTQRLKWTEGERDQLQTVLTSNQEDQRQIENGLRQEMDTLKRRLSEAEAEKQSTKRSIEAMQLMIEEKTASIRHHYVEDYERYKEEKSKLEKKISDLKDELSSVKNGNLVPELDNAQLRTEKEALEQQVHFLNSVIVDMQHKNDDLKSRLDILETEVIFDGHLQFGIPHKSTLRLFCDICDKYDVHDTEDCPKQRSYRRNISQESEF